MIELQEYVDLEGRNAFNRWFTQLEKNVQVRIAVSLNRLKQGSSAVKGVGAGVLEVRLNFGPGYRIYLGKDGETLVILLGGGTKKHQWVDIEAAHRFWQEYKQRKEET